MGSVGDEVDDVGAAAAPDLDTIMYRLAGRLDEERGGEFEDDTYEAIAQLPSEAGRETSFTLSRIGRRPAHGVVGTLQAEEPPTSLSAEPGKLTGRRLPTRRPVWPQTDDRLRTKVQDPDGEPTSRSGVHATPEADRGRRRPGWKASEDARARAGGSRGDQKRRERGSRRALDPLRLDVGRDPGCARRSRRRCTRSARRRGARRSSRWEGAARAGRRMMAGEAEACAPGAGRCPSRSTATYLHVRA